jgi:hypothetical protein
MNAPLDTSNRGEKQPITAEEMKLSAGELRKLPRERRDAIVAAHAEIAAKEYAENPRTIIRGADEIIDY